VFRAVLDANVYVSAAVHPGGSPGQIVERFLREAAFEIVLSPAIAEETLRALSYPKVRKLLRSAIRPELWFEDIVLLASLTPGELVLPRLCADPDDDKYIAAAIEGNAAFVVTGDRRLLAVTEHENVRVLTPRAFRDLLER
jgi:putative PIN family toxin of toxin-antitoxin system